MLVRIPKHETETPTHNLFGWLIENPNINALAPEKECARDDGRAAKRKEMLEQKLVAVRMTAAGEGKGRCASGQAAEDLAFSNPL